MNKRFANKDTGLIVATDLKTAKARTAYWIMFAFLIIASVVCLFPVVWVFMSAFKDLDEFLSVPPTIIPKTFNIKKLPEVWKLLNFQRYYLNSIWLVIGDCVCAVLFNGMVRLCAVEAQTERCKPGVYGGFLDYAYAVHNKYDTAFYDIC